MDQIEECVREIVARVAERHRDQISSDHLLLDDLGIDGDDATALFELYHERFGLDLSSLHLSRHFGSEGLPRAFGAVAITSGALGGVCAAMTRLPGWTGIVFTLVFIALWAGPLKMWPMKPVSLIPITVGDLIDSAKAGHWIDLNNRPAEP